MSSSNCCILTCVQISQEADPVVWYSHLFQNFPVCCDPHSQRLWHSQQSRSRCFSGTLLLFRWSSGCWQFDLRFLCFSKTNLNIWKFMVHVLLKPGLKNFEHYFTSVWDECNCAVVWTFFGIAFLWDWNENWPFPVLWPLLSFLNLLACWVQHFYSIIFQDLKELTWNSITSTSFVVMFSKAHLTSHSRMSGSRWVITHYCDHLGCRDLFCIVLLCILATTSW